MIFYGIFHLCQFKPNRIFQMMESKDGSVKKMIRIHLNAQKKVFQKRKLTTTNPKSITNIQINKISFKSPDAKLITDTEKSQKNLNLQITSGQLTLPSLAATNIDDYGYNTNKNTFQANPKTKSSSEIAGLGTPRETVNKIKRIKSEQSILITQKHDFFRKLSSKCKVCVKNPFQRRLSKNPDNQSFEQSKILDNESNLSQNGCQEITNIIAFL